MPLPRGAPGAAAAVRVIRGRIARSPTVPSDDYMAAAVTRWRTRVRYAGVGAFHVGAGRRIVVDADPGVPDARLADCLLTRVLGVLAAQRGAALFHGSAVAFGDGALALLGPSGSGKSTLAAELHARGHALLADDLLALDSALRVLPGSARVRLDGPTAARVAAGPADGGPDGRGKSAHALHRGGSAPAPLSAVYAVERGESLRVEPLPGPAALGGVLEPYLRSRLLTASQRAAWFQACLAIVARVPVRRLVRPDGLERLTDAVDLIEADAAALAAGSAASARGTGSAAGAHVRGSAASPRPTGLRAG